MDTLTIIGRFTLTFLLALVFGLERQRAHKPIGFGTFTFVSVGSCGLALIATSLHPDNPLPLLAAIVTGIGFLGAGALIKTTDKIFGFTSAASIWIFSIIGLIIGAGEYLIGLFMYAIVWVVIAIDHSLEGRGAGSYQKKLVITTNRMITDEDICSVVGQKHYKIMNIEIDRKSKRCVITLLADGRKQDINSIPKKLSKMEWLDSFKME